MYYLEDSALTQHPMSTCRVEDPFLASATHNAKEWQMVPKQRAGCNPCELFSRLAGQQYRGLRTRFVGQHLEQRPQLSQLPTFQLPLAATCSTSTARCGHRSPPHADDANKEECKVAVAQTDAVRDIKSHGGLAVSCRASPLAREVGPRAQDRKRTCCGSSRLEPNQFVNVGQEELPPSNSASRALNATCLRRCHCPMQEFQKKPFAVERPYCPKHLTSTSALAVMLTGLAGQKERIYAKKEPCNSFMANASGSSGRLLCQNKLPPWATIWQEAAEAQQLSISGSCRTGNRQGSKEIGLAPKKQH